jgi:cation transporter-like permease
VKYSLRQILADSHVAAVTITVLLLATIDSTFQALWGHISHAMEFPLTVVDRLMLISSCSYLYLSVVSFSAAWLLSNWVYGVGPFRSLAHVWENLTKEEHA